MEDEDFREEVRTIVDNQIADNDPKVVRKTMDKLIILGLNETEAKELIGKCLAVELLDVIQNGASYNEKRYLQNLNRLPIEPINE
ncbi:hypothetical protein OAV92_03330 [Crocinitomicaceae bacterium]|jgi:hypothetical protein|nr:hypothetical protein [Crocinitomicaceae bacterium]